MATSQDFHTWTPGPGLDARYLLWVLRAMKAVGDFDRLMYGTTHKTIYKPDLDELRGPLPGLETQRRIAGFLDAEMATFSRLETVLRHLKSLSEERFRAAATAAIFPVPVLDQESAADEQAPAVPYQLLARTGSGHTPSRSVDAYWESCDTPWVTTADVSRLRRDQVEVLQDTTHHISELGMANSAARLHPGGTVFFSRTASVGFSGIMGRPMATSQDFFVWTCGDRLHNRFLLWSLRSMRWQGVFDRLMFGSTHNTIYVPDLMTLRGPVPTIADQVVAAERINEMSTERLRLQAAADRQLELLNERKRALITAAVTGEITV